MRRTYAALVLVAAIGSGIASQAAVSSSPAVQFVPITRAAGLDVRNINGASSSKYLPETMGSGAVFFDYDNDGWVDVFVVDGGSLADRRVDAQAHHRLYRNHHDGTFEDRTARSGIRHTAYGMGACAADYDNDGFVDLYVTGVGANALYHNDGDGTFTDVTAAAGVRAGAWSTSCAFGDFDGDGDVDLFVTRYVAAGVDMNPFCGDPSTHVRVYCHPLNFKGLSNVIYRNDGHGKFTDMSRSSGIGALDGNGLGVVVTDYDDDGRPDVFVANDEVPNFLFHNDGNWRFTESALLAGVAVARDGKPRAGMGVDTGDINGDGLLDLIVTNHEFETHSLFRNAGRGLLIDATVESGIGPPTLPYVGFGTAFLDYDNDTHLDLAIVNGHVIDNTALFRAGSSHAQKNLLFHNAGSPRLTEVGAHSGPGFAIVKVSRGLAVADIDNDGDLDLLVTNNGDTPDLLRNDGGNAGHWLEVRLVGTRSNRDGIGARLRVTVGRRTLVREVKAGSSYLSQNDMRVHVGLGAAAAADRVEVHWPSGVVDTCSAVAANRLTTIREGTGACR